MPKLNINPTSAVLTSAKMVGGGGGGAGIDSHAFVVEVAGLVVIRVGAILTGAFFLCFSTGAKVPCLSLCWEPLDTGNCWSSSDFFTRIFLVYWKSYINTWLTDRMTILKMFIPVYFQLM